MVLLMIRNILCCCGSAGNEHEQGIFDETAHLIVPEIVEADDTFSDDFQTSQRILRERLTEIVRSKEGKMVNVTAHVPFNLHNQVLPNHRSHSSSRSASGSYDPYEHGYHYTDFLSHNREIARFRKQVSKYNHGLGRLRSLSPPNDLAGFSGHHAHDPLDGFLSSRTRSPSPSGQLPTPAKMLNVRLVGYTDAKTRGRTRERGPNPSGLPGSQRSANRGPDEMEVGESLSSPQTDSPTTPVATETKGQLDSRPPISYTLHLSDASAMIMTWGD